MISNVLVGWSLVLVLLGAEVQPAPKSDPAPKGVDPVLSYQDKLSFSVDQDPAPGRPVTVLVTAGGDLEVPVSRCCDTTITVAAVGRRLSEVEADLQRMLAAEYYHQPKVQLRLIDSTPRPGQVWISGAVKANIVQLPQGKALTLWQALVQAGPTEFANLSRVRVHRMDPQSRETRTFVVDVEAVQKGDWQKDLELQDGDRIEVKERWFNLK
jgi:protein involved in polysaccharide export with SLBB domain